MRKLLIIPLLLATLIATGCKQKAATTETPDPTDSTADDSIHTEAYISQRVKHIYDLIYDSYRKNAVNANRQISTEQFTSAEYNNLQREATRLTPKDNMLDIPGADYDHWVMGQDIDRKLSMEVLSVSDITAQTATAKIRVHNFEPTEVTLPLVLENGDWLIDSFITTNEIEGKKVVFDEKKELKEYVKKLRK